MPSTMTSIAAGNVGQELADADDGGNLQDAGHDGGVAGPTAGLGGEGVDLLRIQRGRFAGRQVVGQDHHRLAQTALSSSRRSPSKWRRMRFFDVEQIGDAAGEIAAFDALQGLGVAADDPADGVLGGVILLADQRFRPRGPGWDPP